MTTDISEPSTAKPDFSWEQRGKLLEVLTKLLLFVSTACYVVGIIVVNAQLSRYGYYSFSLLQVQYVFAGVWAMIPIGACFLALSFSRLLSRQLVNDLSEKTSATHKILGETLNALLLRGLKPLSTAYYMLVSVIGFAVLLFLFGSLLGVRQANSVWLWVFLGAAYIVWGVDGLVKPLSFAEHQLPGRVIDVVYGASVVTVVFLIYAAFFGLFAYREIPQNLGGGRPRLVRILINSADSTDLQAVGFSFSTQTSISDPVQLLIDSDKEYVFLVADTSARVSRELVKAVVYEPIH